MCEHGPEALSCHQQANYKDSAWKDEIIVNKWDATFYSKLNILNIYDFSFNKIFPGNLASSMIPILSYSKAHECNMLVTLEVGHFDSTQKYYNLIS